MNNWYKYWNKVSDNGNSSQYLKQVGHTVNGKPYSQQVFAELITNISKSLTLNEQDIVLDLCCGNGVITAQLSSYCKVIVGIDFSVPLIDIAIHKHQPENVSYYTLDIKKLEHLRAPECGQFDKILMYGALQHLQRQDLRPLLEKVFKISSKKFKMVIGGIPDIRRRNEFLDSFSKKLRFATFKLLGRDRIGTWWNPVELRQICSKLDLRCVIVDEDHGRPCAHYRFDAIISQEH